jgi:hypothetical protein
MGFKKFKVQLNQKRIDAIAELIAIGYSKIDAIEILDRHDSNSLECNRDKVDEYESINGEYEYYFTEYD